MAKVRESGMPPESQWSSFFTPQQILHTLGLSANDRTVVDVGCGYGTFAIPAAQLTGGVIHAVDIEPDMLEITRANADTLTQGSIVLHALDFTTAPLGLRDGSVDYVMLFNILHAENPLYLLQEARRLLNSGGRIGIMHWNHDPDTPRGPPMTIRPTPNQVQQWIKETDLIASERIELPPYHYGFIARRRA